MKLDLAISPCPNDTYIFYNFCRPGFSEHEIELHMADVEELNTRALDEKKHLITKMSYYALLKAKKDYKIIKSGGALGRGCGPLLITGGDNNPELLKPEPGKKQRILIPGELTTANLLLRLYLHEQGLNLEELEPVPMRYDLILPALREGHERYGVIIHEERFTYQKMGLKPVQDLGEWWENTTGLPIPLGGIGVRRDLPEQIIQDIEAKISESLIEIRNSPKPAWPFIKENAQALEDEVIQSHIDLYVNDFSLDTGEEGARAIQELERRAKEAGML